MKSDPAASSGTDGEVVAVIKGPEAAGGESVSEAAVGNNNAAAPPAARVKGKTKRAVRKPEPPEPKVVSVKIEKLSEDDIQYFLKNPIRRPKPLPESYFERFPKQPESLTAAFAVINKLVDEREDIAKQYYDKGYAIVRVEYLDNGLRRFSLPNEAAA
ncbi:unnamed protein product [Urochloa humidicola]